MGLSVHNNEDPQNLLSHMKQQMNGAELFPVHRLDKETSGVQILALNKGSARELSQEFQGKRVLKIYKGILRGQLKDLNGSWDKELSDKAEGRKHPAGKANDRHPSLTHFKVLQELPYFTFCEFQIVTGRQHQIRKHTALANHCLVGDSRYGDKKYNEKIYNHYQIDRMFLHCAEIKILGITIQSSLPEEFEQILTKSST